MTRAGPTQRAVDDKPDIVTWPGTVMVSGRMLEILGWSVAQAERVRRRRDDLAPSPALAELRAAVKAAMSADGQTDVRDQADREAEHRWVTTAEVAERLGCSTRHARRLAERLGGVRKQGRWQIDALALLEHEEGR